MPNNLIAKKLGISIQTVKNHLTHIYQKTGVDDRTGLVVKALTTGLMILLLLTGARASASPCTVSDPQPTGNCAVDIASLSIGSTLRTIAAQFTPTDVNPLQVIYGYGELAPGKTAGIYILAGVPYFWGYGQENDFACTPASPLAAGAEASVAFTYDGATLSCYINGQSAGSAARSLDTGQAFASIGSDAPENLYSFTGTIAQLKIGDFETAEQIAADFAAISSPPQWPFVATYGLMLKMSYSPDSGWDFLICPQDGLCGKAFTTPLTTLAIPNSIPPTDVPTGLYVMPYRDGPDGVYFKIGVFQN